MHFKRVMDVWRSFNGGSREEFMPKREVEGFGLGHGRAGRRAAALVSKTPDSTQKPAVETIHENVLQDIDF